MSKNKFIISSAITIALMFTGVQSLATTGTVNTETVKMRSKASTESSVVTLLSMDDKVEIIEKEDDWYKVKYDEKTGYIFAKYITSKEDDTSNNNENDTSDVGADDNSDSQTDAQENDVEGDAQQENNDVGVDAHIDPQIMQPNSQIKITAETEIKIIPLINSNVIGTMQVNTTATILDYVNGWYYVSSSDLEGWVREEKINKDNEIKEENTEKQEEEKEETKTEESETKESTQTTQTKYVNTEKLNIRKSASTDSEIVKSITKNTAVTVLSTSDGWSKVKVGEVEGYISSKYLSDEKVKEETTSNTTTTNRSLEESRTTSSGSEDVVSYAKSYLGSKYVSGGTGPTSFDCSGFTQYIYKNYGVSLAHSASSQAGAGTAVEKSNLQAGDLVLFKGASGSGIGHVGIYIGGNQFIHASNPKGGVKITSMSDSYYSTRYVTSRRVL